MPWTDEQKAFAVEAYFELKSILAVQARFRRHQCRQCPRYKCIYEWIKKFRTHGTILNLNAKGNRNQGDSKGRVRQSYRKLCSRVQVCLQRGGAHLEHIFERQ